MFTGIIEETGVVRAIKQSSTAMELCIEAKDILVDVKLGDSIAVNGVCLTVKHFTKTTFYADVMPETYKATSLRLLRFGAAVNLERAMSANGRFGGHIVSGHVDGVATILRQQQVENAVYIDLLLPAKLIAACFERGSIAVDGTSLTIFKVKAHTVTVSLIPHTYQHSIFKSKRSGDIVNIETDYLAKHVQKQTEREAKGAITFELLQRAGF